MKKILFVLRKPPHSGIHVQEILDVILTTAAFDQDVSLLLLDDGVFQLKSGQNPGRLDMKDTASIFSALEIYDVNKIYMEIESLQYRGLKPGDMLLTVNEVYRRDISRLMKQFDFVIGS